MSGPRRSEHHVCAWCAHAWTDKPWPLGCPACKRGVQWVESYRYPEDAEARTARLVVDVARREIAPEAAS